MSANEAQRRWRLILGPNSEEPLKENAEAEQGQGGASDQQNSSGDSRSGMGKMLGKLFGQRQTSILGEPDLSRDAALQYLYSREYEGRGFGEGQNESGDRTGGQGSSQLNAPRWLKQVRTLFPRSTAEVLQKQALERYGLDELLTDPEVLEQATPSMDLVHTLISCRSLLPAASMGAARRIIRSVVEDLEKKLAQKIRNAITGPRRRGQHGGRASMANLDWSTTIRRNLKHFNQEHDTLVLERLFFMQRNQRKIKWDIIVVVDQSGSMMDSVIHSAVLAAIFTGLQSLRTRLILFDTEVVDISDKIGDPVEVLLGIQLGGGTDIANAMQYAAGRVENPRRTIVVLISDFFEGGDAAHLLKTVKNMNDSGVKLLGLAALDERAEPDYDHQMAQRLSGTGMEIGAMTPDRLAAWVGRVING